MNYIKVSKFDTANGNGIGCVLWVSGCEHHCPHCHNPQTWDLNCGEKFDGQVYAKLLNDLDRPYISRLTLSGGDPLHPVNRKDIEQLLRNVKFKFPNLNIWCYTGYEFEEVKDLPLMQYIDVLVDGEFKIELKDITLPFCGSTNQRVIDVRRTFETGRVVKWWTR